MVPEAVPDDAGPTVLLEAPAGNAQFLVLLIAGLIFAMLVWLPFTTYGWERVDGIHRMAMTDWYKHLMTTTALVSAARTLDVVMAPAVSPAAVMPVNCLRFTR